MTRFGLARYLDYCSEMYVHRQRSATICARGLRGIAPYGITTVSNIHAADAPAAATGKIWQKSSAFWIPSQFAVTRLFSEHESDPFQ